MYIYFLSAHLLIIYRLTGMISFLLPVEPKVDELSKHREGSHYRLTSHKEGTYIDYIY